MDKIKTHMIIPMIKCIIFLSISLCFGETKNIYDISHSHAETILCEEYEDLLKKAKLLTKCKDTYIPACFDSVFTINNINYTYIQKYLLGSFFQEEIHDNYDAFFGFTEKVVFLPDSPSSIIQTEEIFKLIYLKNNILYFDYSSIDKKGVLSRNVFMSELKKDEADAIIGFLTTYKKSCKEKIFIDESSFNSFKQFTPGVMSSAIFIYGINSSIFGFTYNIPDFNKKESYAKKAQSFFDLMDNAFTALLMEETSRESFSQLVKKAIKTIKIENK